MKKILLFALALGTALAVVSCKKTPTIDASHWLDNLEDGLTAAQQTDKKIILFFSADEDNLSKVLKENLLDSDEFVQAETQKYVLVNLDFSNSQYDTLPVEKIKANENAVTLYGVEFSPMFYLLSKEGYVQAVLFYDDTLQTVAQFDAEIDKQREAIAAYDEALARTEKGTNLERVQAIEEVFEMTPPNYSYVLAPLGRKVPALDPKNESGLVGKYVMLATFTDAGNAAMNDDLSRVVEIFEANLENEYLDVEQKQLMYYYTGWYLGGMHSTDYETIRGYFQHAYDLNPTSDFAPTIKEYINQVDEIINEYADLERETADEAAQADSLSAAKDANSFTIE